MKSNPDLDPTPEAIAAMALWADRYSKQRLGSMGFYNSLAESEKRTARDIAQRIIVSAKKHGDVFQRTHE